MPTETFDQDSVYVADIKPLVDELHTRMQKAGIPFFLVACTGSDGPRTQVRGSCLLTGPERTPNEFAIGWEFGAKGMHAGMDMVKALMVHDILKGRAGAVEVVTLTEDKPSADPGHASIHGAEPDAGNDPMVH